jgi:hypothetical protein
MHKLACQNERPERAQCTDLSLQAEHLQELMAVLCRGRTSSNGLMGCKRPHLYVQRRGGGESGAGQGASHHVSILLRTSMDLHHGASDPYR